MKKSILIGYFFIAIIAGITLGIIVHVFNDTSMEQGMIEEVENVNKIAKRNETNIIVTSSNEIKTSPNAYLVFETYYNGCDQDVISKKKIPSGDVNQNEEYFSKSYPDWKIKSFSSEKVELYREKNDMCDYHYIIKENDGVIAIYNVDSNGNMELKETTDIETKYLPEEDVELLKKGIKAHGDNELLEKLSDYE